MIGEIKEYLGAIELEIDGFPYEIGLRKEGDLGLRGTWTCLACEIKTGAECLMPTESRAIDQARLELEAHHQKKHGAHGNRPISKQKPR